jgi:hypothetical protein
MTLAALAVTEGRAVAPQPDRCLHEAGHAVAATALGASVTHTTVRPSPHHPGKDGHTCHGRLDDPVVMAAIAWAGAVAEGTLVYGCGDLDRLGELGHCKPGPAFDLAERIIAGNRHLVDRVAASLADPASEGILFAEDITALCAAI